LCAGNVELGRNLTDELPFSTFPAASRVNVPVARRNLIPRELHRFFSRPSQNFEPALDQERLWIAARALNPAILFPAAHTSTGRTHILRRDGEVFGLGHPIVTVVQPTQSILGKHATRGSAASSASRRSLPQPKVRAVFMMVGNVRGKQPLQVPLVEGNHMVEQLAAAASHPTLGDTILPGACERGLHASDL
jgi:hypothetical protein